MLELEVSGEEIESFKVYHWNLEQDPFGDGERMYCTFEFIGPETSLEEDDEVSLTVRADGSMAEYTGEVIVNQEASWTDGCRLVIVTDLFPQPEDAREVVSTDE